jgi:hypothetical protein
MRLLTMHRSLDRRLTLARLLLDRYLLLLDQAQSRGYSVEFKKRKSAPMALSHGLLLVLILSFFVLNQGIVVQPLPLLIGVQLWRVNILPFKGTKLGV